MTRLCYTLLISSLIPMLMRDNIEPYRNYGPSLTMTPMKLSDTTCINGRCKNNRRVTASIGVLTRIV